jgi:hypothetical protein
LFATITFPACSSSSDPAAPGADATAPAVTASPGDSTFSGASIVVTLSATDNTDPAPVIYYTTDATIPTDMSTVYAGPITVNATTILRFFAKDSLGNASAVQLRGYTKTSNPFEVQWAASGHGDIVGEPFRHWDEDGSVSTSCARCHTGDGFADYAEDGVTNAAAALPLGHYCDTCHTTPPLTRYSDLLTYTALEPIAFPSAATASLWGDSNMCISCHSGRSSTVQVDAKIAGDPGGPYTFTNIHYYAAAASYFGTETKGGYEYAGEEYAGRNNFPSHNPAQQTCVGCHLRVEQPVADHNFVPQVSDCTSCHSGTSFETLSGPPVKNHDAIEAGKDDLLDEIQDYAANVIGVWIAYDGGGYPYFFTDTNHNGVADSGEPGYNQFDESLLKAAYNYQVASKDPAGFIHNGTYIRQILHDSIADLGGTPTIAAPGRPGFDNLNANKSEQWHVSGHAASAGEPFRHWDGDGEVPASCAKCHTSTGFIDYVADGTVDSAAPLGKLVGCSTCHGNANLFADSSTRYDDLVTNSRLEPVLFPSGATATMSGPSNICMTCHQGRESGLSVDALAANSTVQTPTDYDSYSFINRHYYAAAAILFGSEVTGGYEYLGEVYKGRNLYTGHNNLNKCVQCHMRGVQDHHFVPEIADCDSCHQGITDFTQLGKPFGNPNVDFDGDLVGESFQDEIDGMAANLLLGIQAYAMTGLPQASPVVYAPHSYPYWFKDSDGDGLLTPGEDSFANRYNDFDRTLLRAAYNYHSAQDPASDIHNHEYVLQTLYDSMDNLDDGMFNNSVTGLRP